MLRNNIGFLACCYKVPKLECEDRGRHLPCLLHREGFTVAIFKKVKKRRHRDGEQDELVAQPSFSYPATTELANLVVDAWSNVSFQGNPLRDSLLDRKQNTGEPTQRALDTAKDRLRIANIDLVRPVVISEQEHDDGWVSEDPTEIVFVLPNFQRRDQNGAHLVETAKVLMACTPNGI